ncbi:hypothetical protein COCC4DRAFT_143715, partial [Bipolaris maydis ATCC 48331]
IRRRILDNLSAFDAAKLMNLHLCVLTVKEKEKYLKSLWDLVWDVPTVEELSQEGMKLTLFGDGACALKQQLHATEHYLNSYGNRRLTIYMLGTFPVFTPTARLDSLIEFSTTRHTSLVRSYGDKYRLGHIRALLDTDAKGDFVMSSSVPMKLSNNLIKGSWYKVDDVPDRTVGLWVYVPSFCDRLSKEVRLTPMDWLRMMRASPLLISLPRVSPKPTSITTCNKRKLCSDAHNTLLRSLGLISTLSQLFSFCTGRCRLRKWSLTAAGIQSLEATPQEQFSGDDSSERRLTAYLRTPPFGVQSGSRVRMELTQVPNIRFLLDVANHSTLGLTITIA